MSKLETNTIDTISGTTTLQVGDSNVATINLGKSGDTINVPSGATIANSGTATGFGGTNTPAFYAYRATNQSIANATVTILQFATEIFDDDTVYNTSDYRFTPGFIGKSFIHAQAQISTGTDFDNYQLHIYKNGAEYITQQNGHVHYGMQRVDGIVEHDADDYFDIRIYQDAGGAVDVRGSSSETLFQGYKLIT